jgi:hypothetical protein
LPTLLLPSPYLLLALLPASLYTSLLAISQTLYRSLSCCSLYYYPLYLYNLPALALSLCTLSLLLAMPLLSQPPAARILHLLLPAPIYSVPALPALPTLPALSLPPYLSPACTDLLLLYISSISLPLGYTAPTVVPYLSSLHLLNSLVLGTPKFYTLPAPLPLYALRSPLCQTPHTVYLSSTGM